MNYESGSAKELMVNGVWLNPNNKTLRVFGELIPLTETEAKILHLLMSNPGVLFSRNQIMDVIGGDDYVVDERSIDSKITRLRKKIFDSSNAAHTFIETVYTKGYRIPDLREQEQT